MECFPIAMAGKVVEKITEIVINGVVVKQFSYVFCFTSNLRDFRKAAESLKQAQNSTEKDVESARRNTEDIEEDVQQWLDDAKKMFNEIQILEQETNETNGCFLSNNFKYRLSRRLKKKTIQILYLQNKPISKPVGRRVDLPPIEFSQVELNFSLSSKNVFDHIIDWLKIDEVQLIGLYGMGGVGKTTLVQQIGHAAKEKGLFDKVLMVVFSQTPDVRKMQDKIAGELGLEFHGENDETSRANRLLSRLKQEKNMLIILDDVWNGPIKLRNIGIEFDTSQTSCQYIVTTRDSHACTAMMRCQKKVQLNTMAESEAWVLFKEKAGLDDDSSIKNTAIEIAKMCGGLPIAIVTLASALKDTSEYQWEDALDKLKCSKLLEIPNIYGDENVFTCFQLSYDRLESNDLKLCFSLCSLYPEDYEISQEDLTRLAATELDGDDNRSIEKKRTSVEAYIDTLIAKCLLIKCGEGGRKVKMHDMVRLFALRILSNHENYVSGTYMDDSSDFPSDDRLDASKIISVMRKQNINMPSGISYQKLRVLLVRGQEYGKISVGFEFESSTNLRSLHLERCTLLEDMYSLRYLMKIEILSFSNSDITQLPDGVSEMKQLKLLDLSNCWELKKVPDDLLKKLLNLEELYTHGLPELWGEEISKLRVSDLKELKSLKRLSLELIYESLPKGFVFPELKLYSIIIFSQDSRFRHKNFDYSSNFDYRFNILKFENVESTGKNVFGNLLPRVNDLEVEDRSGEIECITPYMHQEGFNKLEALRVSHSDGLKCLVNTADLKEHSPVFLKLAQLELESLPELRCLWQGPTPDAGFKNLTDVSIADCNSLTFVFSESLAQSLIRLQRLKVQRCPILEHIIKEEDEIVISLDHNQTGWFGKLESIDISDCPKLKYIMSIAIAQRLERLEYLSVPNNSGLVQIFGPEEEEEGSSGDIVLPLLTFLRYDKPDHINGISSPSLQALVIREEEESELNRLLNGKQLDSLGIDKKAETWYTVLAMLVKQSHCTLKKISLNDIIELDQMFHLECLGCEEPLSLVSIEYLRLDGLSNLRDIWSGCIYTPNLTKLKISGCNSLRNIFSPTLASNLPLLKELKIKNCDILEAIIGEDNHGESDHPNPTFFTNLTKLSISGCNSLSYIFSPSLARNLSLLEWLAISWCDTLEAIIGEDNHGESDHPKPTYFPNLEDIFIIKCKKLKYIFPISVAVGGLSKLSFLGVKLSDELERVFEGEKEVDDTKILTFPLLMYMYLERLPHLKSFSPVGYHFIFPYMYYITVHDCDKTATRFSINSDGSVHAESKDNSKMLGPGYNVRRKEELPRYLLDESPN